MDQNLTDLARALVACPEWRWASGMRVVLPDSSDGSFPMRVLYGSQTALVSAHEEKPTPDGKLGVGLVVGACTGVMRSDVPDLADPATAGGLLALLVEADPASGWGVSCGPDVGWRATSCDRDLSGKTMGEAVARALLDVWARR